MRKLQIVLPLLLLSLLTFAQQKLITGTVVKNTTKEPLQGVTVQAGNKSVVTDSAGHFSIAAAPGATLTLSYIGMNSLQVKLTSSTCRTQPRNDRRDQRSQPGRGHRLQNREKGRPNRRGFCCQPGRHKRRADHQPHARPSGPGARPVHRRRWFPHGRQRQPHQRSWSVA
ncbi:carboxypeptidase-like regulatory domain-containing protein [Puia sp. P3]|uniref:carboxypeptidase-like regulatory domain-containing protein n=1 Tax=Puia sp. P3 TaxID=3423952 RepID=UPI003D6771A5